MKEHAEVFLIPVACVFCFLAYHGYRINCMLDEFLELLYMSDRQLWESLGKPTSRLWRPPGSWPNLTQTTLLCFKWLRKKPPEWLIERPELRTRFECLQMRLRRWNLVYIPISFGVVATMMTLIYFITRPN